MLKKCNASKHNQLTIALFFILKLKTTCDSQAGGFWSNLDLNVVLEDFTFMC